MRNGLRVTPRSFGSRLVFQRGRIASIGANANAEWDVVKALQSKPADPWELGLKLVYSHKHEHSFRLEAMPNLSTT